MRRSLMLLGLVALGAATLGACGTDSTTSPIAPTATNAADTTNVGATATGDVPKSLQFSAPKVGGGSLDFTGFQGTTVALWFWAPT